MHSHQHYRRRPYLAERVAEPQNDRPTTRFTLTPPPLPTNVFSTRPATNRNNANNDDDNTEQRTTARARPTTTGVLLGAPVAITSTEEEPAPTQNSSPDDGSDSSQEEAPTQDAPAVVATSSAVEEAPSTTFATSAVPTSDFGLNSSSSARTSSKTTSSVGESSTTGSNSAGSSSSEGMSTGAKVGLAVGIIAIIGAFALFLMLFMAKKRKQREAQEKVEDEKRAAEQAAAASAAAAAKQRTSAPNAPRLSLRPVSRLVPDLMGGRSRNRNSQGNMLTTFSETRGDRSMSPAANMQQSHPRENPFNDPVNPFNDPEKAAAAGVAAAAYQQPHTQAHELEDTRSMGQPSRPGTSQGQFPGAPAPAVATGPGPEQPQGNVYRILMEFKPTMEDELELRAGQHVRLLHEYDDGWALCIKLDRSQQGVVPRTCLAAKPSKPRPAPGQGPNGPNGPNGYRGPPGPQGRPMTPNGPGGPRMNSPSFRPDSPANRGPDSRPQTAGSGAPRGDNPMTQGSFNQAPRPLSPGPRPTMRSESPGPYGAGGPPPMHGATPRPRSNSTNNSGAPGPRQSPPARSNLGPGASNGPGFAF